MNVAKQRSGLGRGLGSLLGVGVDGTLAQENPEPEVVKEEKENAPVEEISQTPAPAPPSPPSAPAKEEAIYSSKEDNITIKEVVEREVSKPTTKKAVVDSSSVPTRRKDDDDEVSIDLIEANPNQPRTNFKKEDLEELAESIKRNGLLQPILVRTVGERYQIIAGERRWQACKMAGLKKVPVRVKEVDDDETIMLALVENIQRSDLNPIEEAYGYRRMMERGNMTQSEVAQAVSKGRSTIANALRLLELPEEAQQLLYEERITAGHARAILSIPTTEGRRKLTDKLVEKQLSVREAESMARLLSGKVEKEKKETPQVPKSYKTVARALKDTLTTDVKIRSVKGKNKIEIEFKDEADLERLFRIIATRK